MKWLILFFFSFLINSNIHAQIIQRSFPIDVMMKNISKIKDTVTVVTFWSVWFDESEKALDDFANLHTENRGRNIKVIFCNLDFNYNQDSLVKPFLLQHNFKCTLWHVAETDPDKWKAKIDTSWTGGFPAVVAYYNGKKIFFKEGVPDMNELKQTIHPYLK